MSVYDHLYTSAFRLNRAAIASIAARGAVLHFDRDWVEPMLELLRQRKPNMKSLPIASLNTAILALLGDVTASYTGVGSPDGTPEWLFSARPGRLEAVWMLLTAWLRAEAGSQMHGEAALQLAQQLCLDQITWQDADAQQLAWRTGLVDHPEATDALATTGPSVWSLVPELLADQLLQVSSAPDWLPARFRRVASKGRGIELVSWPPIADDDTKNRPDWFSYRITLSVQATPMDAEPRLLVHVGVRRWLNKTPKRKGGAAVNAHLLSSTPWISGASATSGFRIAPLVWRQRNDIWRLEWKGQLRPIFDLVTFQRPLPDLERLAKVPVDFHQPIGDDQTAIGLPYTTSSDGKHKVGAGASARDRHQLLTWVGENLSTYLTPADPLPSTTIRVKKPANHTASHMRTRIATAIGNTLAIEVHHDSYEEPGLRNALYAAIVADLGLGEPVESTNAKRCWMTPELTVIISEHPIGSLGAPLQLDQSIDDKKIRLRTANDKRCKHVTAHLGAMAQPTVALIELRGRDAFTVGTDPKAALRIGFIATGRHTQFLRPESEAGGIKHRTDKAWKDLRRQIIGCTQAPAVVLQGKAAKTLAVPEPLDTVAIYMLRRNATRRTWSRREQLPLAIWISSDSPDVYAQIPGHKDAIAYKDLASLLADGSAFATAASDDFHTSAFIKQVLAECDPARPTLIQAWIQNLRSVWPDIGATRLRIDDPRLNDERLNNFANKRLVLVRTKDYLEVPECYGMIDANVREDTNGKQLGITKGLWELPGSTRTFTSTSGRPDSAKSHGSPMGSRIAPRYIDKTDDDTGETTVESYTETAKPVFNPLGLQIIPAWLQPGDNPLTWAAITHAHRELSDTYDATLQLPLALHLAKKATEYAFPDTDDEAPDYPTQ